jgi:small-conductance mechanosensitive channel
MMLVPLQAGMNQPTGANRLVASFLQELGVPDAVSVAIGSAVAFLVVGVLGYALWKTLLIPLVDRLLSSKGLDAHARRPLRKVAGIVFGVAVIAFAFGFAGYGEFLQSLATVAAAGTLAIGFALQDVIANFVAGVFIYADRPFRIGDWIEWEDKSGIVEDISFRVTRVRTFDNELLTVPNSHLTDGVIKNPVAKDTLRLQFTFGIGYNDDVEEATTIIVDEAERHADILTDPAPSVRMTELADSYVGLRSRIWIDNPSRADFVKIRSEYVKNVKARFDEAGIEIPFPQRDLSGAVDVELPPENVRK